MGGAGSSPCPPAAGEPPATAAAAVVDAPAGHRPCSSRLRPPGFCCCCCCNGCCCWGPCMVAASPALLPLSAAVADGSLLLPLLLPTVDCQGRWKPKPCRSRCSKPWPHLAVRSAASCCCCSANCCSCSCLRLDLTLRLRHDTRKYTVVTSGSHRKSGPSFAVSTTTAHALSTQRLSRPQKEALDVPKQHSIRTRAMH